MSTLFDALERIGLIPVIKIDNPEQAPALASALIAGGIPCAEVTFRTAAAEEAIRRIKGEVPTILLGAGTVLTIDQVDRAAAAGASFIVSPGFNPAIVSRCLEKGIAVLPGCLSPSDIERALEAGLTTVKFFPAEPSGGIEYIKALAGPFPMMRYVPTGGVHAGNMLDYLAFDKILAIGGSWMVPSNLLDSGNFEGITALCREAIAKMLGFAMAHLGINAENEAKALEAAKMLEALFSFAPRIGNSSVFAGDGIELMKSPYLGKNGHIGIATHSLLRAQAYLESRGIAFNKESAKTDAQGAITSIYLEEELLGFAIHLMKK